MTMVVIFDRVECVALEEGRGTVKVRKSLKSLKQKPGAQVIRRHGKTFVINKKTPRYKARQG